MKYTQKELQAGAILSQYGKTLPKKWKGLKEVWHAWHQPHLVYQMSWGEYVNRVIEIEDTKPVHEKPLRFKLLNLVKGKFRRTKAYAEWNKAYAEWKKADAEWKKADAEEIQKLHRKECKDCSWDGKQVLFKETLEKVKA